MTIALAARSIGPEAPNLRIDVNHHLLVNHGSQYGAWILPDGTNIPIYLQCGHAAVLSYEEAERTGCISVSYDRVYYNARLDPGKVNRHAVRALIRDIQRYEPERVVIETMSQAKVLYGMIDSSTHGALVYLRSLL